MRTAKLGLEYEPIGPFYIMHGVALEMVRLVATARSRAKLRFDFKARDVELIPASRDYTHERIDQYGQTNFETETIAGPCYEDAAEGLSCKVIGGSTVLATEDGFILTTEDGYEILLDSEETQHEPQVASAFAITVNGEPMLATEISFEGREPKTPARFDRQRKPEVMRPGEPSARGELALYMNGDEVPLLVRGDSEAAIVMTADFGSNRSLTITMPRVKFSSGTPDLVSRGELVYRAPFSVLEPAAADDAQSTVTLVI